MLRVKPQTLKSRLHRGRLILRQHLGDFAGGLALHDRESVTDGAVRRLSRLVRSRTPSARDG